MADFVCERFASSRLADPHSAKKGLLHCLDPQQIAINDAFILESLNDAFILESLVFKTLNRHFAHCMLQPLLLPLTLLLLQMTVVACHICRHHQYSCRHSLIDAAAIFAALPWPIQIAINDAFILESLVFKSLNRHFAHEPYYLQLVELFHDTTYRTEMGQLLDLTSQPLDKPPDFTRFTKTRYSMIVKYKTAFYTFYLPCAIGMVYAGVRDTASFDLARRICCTIGEYFQIQDDYLDCFGDPATIGKVGTDIQDMKCSWLVVQALERCDDDQKAALLANYGQNDPDKIAAVKKLYGELDLPAAYTAYEEESYADIQALIAQVTDVPKDVYDMFVKRIYKRKM